MYQTEPLNLDEYANRHDCKDLETSLGLNSKQLHNPRGIAFKRTKVSETLFPKNIDRMESSSICCKYQINELNFQEG